MDAPKGTDVVKDAIRKMKFNKQIKKAEGQKPPKVELTISVDGVTVQDPKTKVRASSSCEANFMQTFGEQTGRKFNVHVYSKKHTCVCFALLLIYDVM